MRFRPEEVLFSPTISCNLRCPHCNVGGTSSNVTLSTDIGLKFLRRCARHGIRRVGFTGGEPFLAFDFMLSVVREAVSLGLFFDRIMTNGVWWSNAGELKDRLERLHRAGYDGSIYVSFDAFHAQSVIKVARLIRTAARIWRRPDIVSLACVTGAKEIQTRRMLGSLARATGTKLKASPAGNLYLRSDSLFIKTDSIDLVSLDSASDIPDQWNGRWFREDHCTGPGNVFLVMPDGGVKPCCGYASDSERLTVGNIKIDYPEGILMRLAGNRFASTVFNSGLVKIRKRLEASGIKFPGRTSNHCFFCHYILNHLPKGALDRCLDP